MAADATADAVACAPLVGAALWRRRPGLPATRPHDAVIETGRPVAMAPGVLLLRLPLPFALDHVNVYLLEEADGWTIVDCGLDTPAARAIWAQVLSSEPVGGRPVRQIVVTHHHPDHVGLAGWLATRCGAPVRMTPGERAVAGRYADRRRDAVAERSPLWHEHGLPRALALELADRMPRYAVQVHPLPSCVEAIDTSGPLVVGGRRWQPIVGRGHSPEHLSLLCDDGSLMIGGDQVLPKITPNIAVWPGGDTDPLRSYLASLRDFDRIEPATLLLPSHKQPMWGVARRVEEIRAHHEGRLRAVLDACRAAATGYEILPALFGRPLRDEEVGFGLGEAIAHLNFLESAGLLASSLDGDGVRRFALIAAPPTHESPPLA